MALRRGVVLGCALGLALGAACARVRPHERQALAHPAMATTAWPAVERADQHVFSVREGTEGASAEGGGGCGCN